MDFILVDIKKQRRLYPQHLGHKHPDQEAARSRFLSLDQYHELARRIIVKFAPRAIKEKMLSNEDAVDFVAHRIMMGDWIYDEKISKINTFRGGSGKKAIFAYLKKIRTQRNSNYIASDGIAHDVKYVHPHERLIRNEEHEEKSILVEKLMDCLNDLQKKCIGMHYMEGIEKREVAKRLNLSKFWVHKNIVAGIERMRGVDVG